MKTSIQSTTWLLLCLLPGALPAAIYKWVDENGQVQYTQTPPPGNIEAREMQPPPPPADADGAIERQQQLEESLDAARSGREEAARTAAEEAELRQQKQQRCDAARLRLERNNLPRISVTEADGSERRISEEERLENIRVSEQQVKEYCEQ